DRPGIAAAIFKPLADASISVDVIAQAASLGGITELSFTIGGSDLPKALPMMRQVAEEIHATALDTADTLAKVSIVGTGMQTALGQALARVLGGVVDYAALRAAAEGDYATLARELRRLRLAVERAESLLQGTHPAP